MKANKKSTMTWEEAPDTISPTELSEILGICIISARKIFDQKDFPKVSKSVIGNIGKADKEAARLYVQGFRIKEKPKETLDYLILLELKKLTNMLKNNEIEEENVKCVL